MVAKRRVPLVFFLIADTGGGHRSAANAIRAAMDLMMPETFAGARPASLTPISTAELDFPPAEYLPANWSSKKHRWRAEIRDIFQECGNLAVRRVANMYGPTVEKTPGLYAGFYHVSNIRPVYATMSVLTQSAMRKRLVELLEELHPDVIVSVHPLISAITLNVMTSLGVKVPFLTVVTDLVKFHRAWAVPGVDECSVPTTMARDLLIEFGMPPEKLRLLGMPIHPKFCLPAAGNGALRADLGLDPDRYTVLLVGGGEGVKGLGEATLALAASQLPIQLIVVTGRNHALYDDLTERQPTLGVPTKILGFVNTMPDLMHAADIIVTKAGPGTIMEALSCGLPIILTGAIPGQEEGNVEFVEQHGVGVLARSPDYLVQAVRQMLNLSDTERESLKARARELSSARASFAIARLVMSYLPGETAESPWAHRRRVVRYVRRRSGGRRVRLSGTGDNRRGLRRLPFLRNRQRRPARRS